jgi:hypothetical protein
MVLTKDTGIWRSVESVGARQISVNCRRLNAAVY